MDKQRLAHMLMAMGAGFQGQSTLPYVQAGQQLSDERKRAAAIDAQKAKQLIEQGNVQGARQLLQNRIDTLKKSGRSAKETEQLLSWIDGGAMDLAMQDLNGAVQMGAKYLPQDKYLGMQGGQAAYMTPDNQVVMRDIAGYQQPGMSPLDAATLAKTQAQTSKAIAETKKINSEAGRAGAPKPLELSDLRSINNDITSLTKEASTIHSAASRLSKIAKTKSPTDQLAAIFTFMKALDPTSVVREGEQAQARKTGGPADWLVGYVNKIKGEGSLPPNVFNEMVMTAQRLSNQSSTDARSAVENYLNPYGDKIPQKARELYYGRLPSLFELQDSNQDEPTIEDLVNRYAQ